MSRSSSRSGVYVVALSTAVLMVAILDLAVRTHASSPLRSVSKSAFTCPKTDDELAQLYSDNLEPDFAPWRNQSLRMSDIDTLMKQHPENDVRRLVMLYKNKLYFPLQNNSQVIAHMWDNAPQTDSQACWEPCNHLLHDVRNSLSTWIQNLTFPDMVFYVSVRDQYHCPTREACGAPMLSIAKLVGHPINGSAWDILIPKAPIIPRELMDYPWELKSNKPVWRGTFWCEFAGIGCPVTACARELMWRVSQMPNATGLFDFGFTSTNDPNIPPVPRLSFEDIAKYKFMLSLDGYTAAYRVSRLMLTNSVLLKQESYLMEYFYRSMVPYRHYIPVFKTSPTDVIDIVKEYQKPERDADLRRIAKDAQMFAARYACPSARMLYWRKVLVEYMKLFPDMDQIMRDKWIPLMEEKLGKKLLE